MNVGIQTDLFLKQPSGHMLCPICKEVMRDSVISCMQGHAFCTVCIVASMHTRNTCPTCRAPTLSSPIPNQVVRALIGDLEVKCPFNSVPVQTIIKMREKNMLHLLNQVNACDWIGNVHSLGHHLHTCGFQLVACPIKGCPDVVLKNKLEHHLEVQCTRRTVYCDFCGMEVLKMEYEAHQGSCRIWSLRRSASQNRPSNHAVSSEPREWYIAQQQMIAFNSETSSVHRSPNSSGFLSNPPPLRDSFSASPSPSRISLMDSAAQPPSVEAFHTSAVGYESIPSTQFSDGRAHAASQSPARINTIDSSPFRESPLQSELRAHSPSYISAASSSSQQIQSFSRDMTMSAITIPSADRYQDDTYRDSLSSGGPATSYPLHHEPHTQSSEDVSAAANRANGSPAEVAIASSSSSAKRASFAASPEPSRNAIPQKSLNKGFSSQYVKKASVAASPEPSKNAIPQKSFNKGFSSHYGGFRNTGSMATSPPPVAAEEVQSKSVINPTTKHLKHSPSWWGGNSSSAAVQVNSKRDNKGRDSPTPFIQIDEADGPNVKQNNRSLLGRIMNASPILGFSANSKNDGSSGVPAAAVGNKASPSKRIKSEYSMWTLFNSSHPSTETKASTALEPPPISLPEPSIADLLTDDNTAVANAVASPSTSSTKRSKSEYAMSASPRPVNTSPSTTSKPKVETTKPDLKSNTASIKNGDDRPQTTQRSMDENSPEPKAPVSILKSSSDAPASILKSSSNAPVSILKSSSNAPVSILKSSSNAPVSILKSSSKYSAKKKVPQRSTERESGGSPINVSTVTASTAQIHPKPKSNSNPEATRDRLEAREAVKDTRSPASSNPPSTKQMKVAQVPITSNTPPDAKAASSASASFKFIQHTSNSSYSSKPPRLSSESSVDYSTIEMKIRSVEQDMHIQSFDTTAQTESSTLSLSTSVSSPPQRLIGEADTAATSDRDAGNAEIQRHTQEQNSSSVTAVSPSSSPSPVRHSIISSKPPLPPSKRHTASRPEKGIPGVGSVQQTNKERSAQKDLSSRGLDHIPERSSTPPSHLMIRSSTPAQYLFEQYDDDSNESSKHFEEYLEDRPATSNTSSSMHSSFKKIAAPHADAPLERAGAAAALSTTTRSTAATGESSRTFQKRTKV